MDDSLSDTMGGSVIHMGNDMDQASNLSSESIDPAFHSVVYSNHVDWNLFERAIQRDSDEPSPGGAEEFARQNEGSASTPGARPVEEVAAVRYNAVGNAVDNFYANQATGPTDYQTGVDNMSVQALSSYLRCTLS